MGKFGSSPGKKYRQFLLFRTAWCKYVTDTSIKGWFEGLVVKVETLTLSLTVLNLDNLYLQLTTFNSGCFLGFFR